MIKLRREIPIEKFVIRVMHDIATDDDFAHLIAIDNEGKEHTFGYVGDDGQDYNLYVASPKEGKIGWKPHLHD
jgi:hypothetical protein